MNLLVRRGPRPVTTLSALLFVACTGGTPRPAPAPTPSVRPPAPEPPAAPPAPSASAPDAADAGVNPLAELAWLRAHDPDVAELRSGSPVAELLSWFDEAETESLWVVADKFRCAPVRAKHVPGDDRLRISILESDQRVGGKRVRTWVDGYAGFLLSYGSSGKKETQQKDGRWVSDHGWGRSGGSVAGALSALNDDRASFDGQAVFLQVSCPKVPLACDDGGTRNCKDCKAFDVHVHVLSSLHGGFGIIGPKLPKATCDDPCPPLDTTNLDRAKRALEMLPDKWIPSAKPAPTGLYLSEQTCKAALR